MRDGDAVRLARMLETAEKLLAAIERRGLSKERLLADEDAQWFVTTPLYQIGEQANNVSREFADSHPEIPLVQMAGLRHRLVHSYDSTNWNLMAEVVFEDVPQLVRVLSEIVR